MKHCKTIDKATIVRLLSHEDEQGMGRVFMYAFVNEVIRQKRPFSFDCESAQVSPNLIIVDNQGRSIAVEHKRNQLCITLNGQHTEALSHIEYKGKAYRQVILAWLTACIRYTSLQPELRIELTEYVKSIRRRFWWINIGLCNNSAQSFPIFAPSKLNHHVEKPNQQIRLAGRDAL